MTISISKARQKTTPAIEDKIRARALTLGLDAIRFAAADVPQPRQASYQRFLRLDRHGEMGWLKDRARLRATPQKLWPKARSVVMAAINYGPECNPLPELARKDRGYISVYARHRDYHDVLKGRLKQLAGFIASATGAELKVFVDTAPVLEKPLAQRAGLGWQGKHTNLLSRELGNWFFLGGILLDQPLEADVPERDHCGNCRKCLDICPTEAFPAPYELDARRCISYLTIEHKSQIPREFRKAIGNRIYGCDDCLAVCPWNKFAVTAKEAKLKARNDLTAPRLDELAKLDDTAFRQKFAGSPIKRIGRDRFVRNVLIAIGNSGDRQLAAAASACLHDASPLVRGMAVWAWRALLGANGFQAQAPAHMGKEIDPTILEEWHVALDPRPS
ncbi:MAG: tRNA epoxyqueuosine(34) reductase QueG [Pseudomonadota bacterium]